VATSLVDAPRAATIHEYLDWTVTAEEASTDEELVRAGPARAPRERSPGAPTSARRAQDFGGFRVVVLLPRFKPGWPPPGAYEDEAPKRCKALGAPRNPLPLLMPNGKPICAATIRAGDRFLEVPFFATQETRRNRGFGRALLEARPPRPPPSGDRSPRRPAPGR
jgi:ribosomal protein S18 acetylase RimI-like enzyme